MANDFREKTPFIRRSLAEPCHGRRIRTADHRVHPTWEADVSGGWTLEVSDPQSARELEVSRADCGQFMSVAMAVGP